tara:strand:- start:1309 stop:1542 length:234 start_codon:yes stop_codon:yes gene_type:complete
VKKTCSSLNHQECEIQNRAVEFIKAVLVLYSFNKTVVAFLENESLSHKKWQATYITPLRPYTLAAFPPWGIQQELVV